MSSKIDSKSISKCYVGTDEIAKIYEGSNLAWESGGEPPVSYTKRILIDMNTVYSVTGETETWNGYLNGMSLVDIDNVSTGVSISNSGTFGNNQSGVTNSTIYPVNTSRDSLFLNNTTGTFTLSGLDSSKQHKLTFYASRNGVSDVRTCDYTCVGATTAVAKLDSANNIDNTDFVEIKPDASGEIAITMSRSTDSTSVYIYIGVIDIEY